MRWFGERWKGEVCETFLQIANPGGDCCFCRQPVGRDDQGFAFEGGAICHKKCLSRGIVGRAWVDHVWTSKMHTMWDRGWTCSNCGIVVFGDPETKEGREKNRRDRGVKDDCNAHLVDAVSKS